MSGSNSKLSSKLKQLRFMQRAAKKQEQEEVVAEEQAATKSVSLGDGLGVSQVRCSFFSVDGMNNEIEKDITFLFILNYIIMIDE